MVGGGAAGTDFTGYIYLDENGSKITVDGDVVGGTGTRSGSMQTPFFDDTRAEKIFIKIGGDLIGGTGNDSGRIFVAGMLNSFSVGNDLLGGDGNNAGQVYTTGGIGKILIGHSVNAGDGVNSGAITTLMDIKSLTVENNVWGKVGINYSQIGAAGSIGSLVVKGDMVNSIVTAMGASLRPARMMWLSRNFQWAWISRTRPSTPDTTSDSKHEIPTRRSEASRSARSGPMAKSSPEVSRARTASSVRTTIA